MEIWNMEKYDQLPNRSERMKLKSRKMDGLKKYNY